LGDAPEHTRFDYEEGANDPDDSYFRATRGGYGIYYTASLEELGITEARPGKPVELLRTLGQELASAFARAPGAAELANALEAPPRPRLRLRGRLPRQPAIWHRRRYPKEDSHEKQRSRSGHGPGGPDGRGDGRRSVSVACPGIAPAPARGVGSRPGRPGE